MSSALSRMKAVSFARCSSRLPYGMTEQRRSRHVAAAGMFGVMSLSVLCALTLLAERTLTLPPVRAAKRYSYRHISARRRRRRRHGRK